MGGQLIEWTPKMLKSVADLRQSATALAAKFGCSTASVYNKRRELTAAAVPPPATELVPAAGSVAATNIVPAAEHQVLVAMRPDEMHQAQRSLAAWFGRKVELACQDAHDARRNLEIATEAGLKADSFARAARMAERRAEFYEKALAATEAGYAIVPGFPVDVLAIRVTRKNPKWRSVVTWDKRYAIHAEDAPLAPAGEGRYVNPQPTQTTHELSKKTLSDGREIEQFSHTIAGFSEEPEFPVAIAQPIVLEAVQQAMALKVFDEIGCLPARKKPDPIVVGRIYRPNDRHRQNPLTFLIAWWIDTRTL